MIIAVCPASPSPIKEQPNAGSHPRKFQIFCRSAPAGSEVAQEYLGPSYSCLLCKCFSSVLSYRFVRYNFCNSVIRHYVVLVYVNAVIGMSEGRKKGDVYACLKHSHNIVRYLLVSHQFCEFGEKFVVYWISGGALKDMVHGFCHVPFTASASIGCQRLKLVGPGLREPA